MFSPTPGPWRVAAIRGSKVKMIISTSAEPEFNGYYHEDYESLEVPTNLGLGLPEDHPEYAIAIANDRLKATAPEMLDILKRVKELWDDLYSNMADTEEDILWEKVEVIISKAEGEKL